MKSKIKTKSLLKNDPHFLREGGVWAPHPSGISIPRENKDFLAPERGDRGQRLVPSIKFTVKEFTEHLQRVKISVKRNVITIFAKKSKLWLFSKYKFVNGKDIDKFDCLYWQVMLNSLGIYCSNAITIKENNNEVTKLTLRKNEIDEVIENKKEFRIR